PATSPLAVELRRNLESQSQARVTFDPQQALQCDVIFDLLGEQIDRIVVGLNAAGQVRELQLRLRVKFRLRTPGGKEVLPPTELMQTSDISYNESAALAKEAEEALLNRSMRSDIVQQIIRRLAAVREL
ncbi:MAG TPA: LPS assembly lipoprotein LptE, partial [Burkholderiaceae bacterium]